MKSMTTPKVTAAAVAAACARLAGTLVLDLADGLVGPAIYKERLAAFETIDGEHLGEDDGSLINLLERGVTARDLVEEHGTPGKAAAALTKRLRAEFATETSSAGGAA